MTPEFLFQLCSTMALCGWLILLLLSPFWLQADKIILGLVIVLLALFYTGLIFVHFDFSAAGKMGSLAGVMELFTAKALVTAGWIHYLAFDLLAGLWIKRNAVKHHIPHGAIAPALLLTFMLGPVGLLVFLVTRWFYTKRYFAENF